MVTFVIVNSTTSYFFVCPQTPRSSSRFPATCRRPRSTFTRIRRSGGRTTTTPTTTRWSTSMRTRKNVSRFCRSILFSKIETGWERNHFWRQVLVFKWHFAIFCLPFDLKWMNVFSHLLKQLAWTLWAKGKRVCWETIFGRSGRLVILSQELRLQKNPFQPLSIFWRNVLIATTKE